MTEPGVASSDATNMEATAIVDGDEVVINGRKWWSTGVGHPDCKILVFMGLTDPEADRHHRHTMVLVPRDTPGVKVERMLSHDERCTTSRSATARFSFDDVRVPTGNISARPGRGVRDRPGPARARAGPPLHAADRPGRGGARAGLQARPGAGRRSASRSSTSAATGSGSPTPGSRSTRPGCWCSTRRGSSTSAGRSTRSVEVSQIKVDRAQHGPAGDRHGDPDARRRRAVRRLPAGRRCGPTPGRCGSPTAPTRCTAASSPGSSSASTAASR